MAILVLLLFDYFTDKTFSNTLIVNSVPALSLRSLKKKFTYLAN